MTNVDCLKELYTKITGKDITDINIDTICEVIELLAKDLNCSEIVPIENVSNQFSIVPYDSNITIGDTTLKVTKNGKVYRMYIISNFTVAQLTGSNAVILFSIKMPQLTGFTGAIGSCFIVDNAKGITDSGVLQVGGISSENLSLGIARLTNQIAAGTYQLNADITFMT